MSINMYPDTNRFSALPTDVQHDVSRFNRSYSRNTTMNSGLLYPICVDELLPGDSVKMDMAVVARMSTPLVPVMDDCFIDIYWFSVPLRILYNQFTAMFGEAEPSEWNDPVAHELPFGYVKGAHNGLWDNMGVPPEKLLEVNMLPFRAYQRIWNDWFRDQNLQDSLLINYDDDGASDSESDLIDALLPVNKVHDFFTSCLPSPQKGPSVLFGSFNDVPIVPKKGTENKYLTNPTLTGFPTFDVYEASGPNQIKRNDGTNWGGNHLIFSARPNPNGLTFGSAYQMTPEANGSFFGALFNNMYADMSNAGNMSINDLRNAIAFQQFLELDARGGSRYREYINNHFGVSIPDATAQVPEYLGGKRIPITMNQVVQTSSTAELNINGAPFASPLGGTGAYSKTIDSSNYFSYTSTEHCYLFGVACIRYKHSYQQGVPRLFSRRSKFDFYDPIFANLGEQPVYNKQIFALDESTPVGISENNEVFGYQEAWAEYRYHPNEICGDFRSDAPNGSLDFWHYGDFYESVPRLSGEWIKEDKRNIDRTLAVSSEDGNGNIISNQFLVNIFFNGDWIRQMPVYSVPGLDTI